MATAKQTVQKLFSYADIHINGNRPWDIQVKNPNFYKRVLTQSSLGLGESYMEGWWDCDHLDQFFERLLSGKLQYKVVNKWDLLFQLATYKLFNMQTKFLSKKVAKQHYDVGNTLYSKMLGKRMQYTCAYWKNAKTLDQAQENKLDLICKKLQLKKGERVLELGCGWGGFAKYAAEKYGVHVTAYNISKEQVKYARELCKGLNVEIIQADYRDAKGTFDKVAAIGLLEHVGHKNYRNFMKLGNKCLKKGGLFLVHTIGKNIEQTHSDPWIQKYIFPQGEIPAPNLLIKAAEGMFVMEDWHNFGPDYDKTLLAWYTNFNRSWPEFREEYGERFYRMWRYYLLGCAAGFRARKMVLWQVVFSKGVGSYTSIR